MIQHRYELSTADIFRFDLFVHIRRNLLATAGLLVAVLAGALWYMGQMPGLLDWVPPVVAMVIFILILARSRIRSYRASGLVGDWNLSIDPLGIHITSPTGNEVSLNWSNVRALHQKKCYFYILVDSAVGIIIPKRCFTVDELQELENIVRQSLPANS